jgi:bacterioferritin
MGTLGRKIVAVDVKKLIKLLNKALADEWLAYYQYWVGAKVATGLMREIVSEELTEHANEELKHANILADRILQLGGTPLLDPQSWHKQTNCGYELPKDPNTKTLLKQNIDGERCAIKVYKKLLAFVKNKDEVSYRMLLEILEDEIEHEDDLEAIVQDMKVAKK